MNNLNNLLEKAISETEKLCIDEIFLLKELFLGYEWKRLDRSSRLLLGTLFLHWAKSNNNVSIIPIEKTSSGQQQYRKGSL